MRLRTGSAMKPRSKWRPWAYERQRTADVREIGMLRQLVLVACLSRSVLQIKSVGAGRERRYNAEPWPS